MKGLLIALMLVVFCQTTSAQDCDCSETQDTTLIGRRVLEKIDDMQYQFDIMSNREISFSTARQFASHIRDMFVNNGNAFQTGNNADTCFVYERSKFSGRVRKTTVGRFVDLCTQAREKVLVVEASFFVARKFEKRAENLYTLTGVYGKLSHGKMVFDSKQTTIIMQLEICKDYSVRFKDIVVETLK